LFLPIFTDVHNERIRFERYLEMPLDRRIEGLVFVANWLFVGIHVLADLEKNNIPTAIVGRELKNDNISSLIVDNHLGARRSGTPLFARSSQDRPLPAALGNCRTPNPAGLACRCLPTNVTSNSTRSASSIYQNLEIHLRVLNKIQINRGIAAPPPSLHRVHGL
jgi:hypothetical protein